MKRKPNTKLIGAFVTAAIALTFGMVLFFGSTSMFSRNVRFILFFDQSVNGLSVGSAVKFRGVPIGTVERIQIRAEGQDPTSKAIPVLVRIDRSHMENELGVSGIFDHSTMESTMPGLVAQLRLASVITGQLFVEFTFDPDKVKDFRPHLDTPIHGIAEIPTFGSSLDRVTDELVNLISAANSIDIKRLNENVNVTLENLSIVLAGIDSAGISESVIGAADQVNAFVGSDELERSLVALHSSLGEIQLTAESFNLEDGPLADTINEWTVRLDKTLGNLDRLTEQTGEVMEPDSSVRVELENTLRELGRAALSIRQFVDYLERNPKALISGRPEGDQ